MGLPRVLVIGSGFAGVAAAQALSTAADVTLVSKTDYFELTWATVRAVVDAKVADQVTVPLTAIPKLGRVVRGSVASISKNSATLDSGEVISFDYAIVASGSAYSDSFGKSATAKATAERKAEIEALRANIKAAKNVIVVGGGPAGVEVAAEIVETYAGKEVTLVTSGTTLLEGKAPKMTDFTAKFLQERGVKLIFKDRIDRTEQTSGTFTTRGGAKVEGDVILWCLGITPNSSFFKDSMSSALDAKGFVKVDSSLRVQGFPNIFAVGDVNNVPDTKLGFLSDLQAKFAAANLLAIVAGGKPKEWKPRGGMPDMMMVTLGKGSGAGHMGGCSCTGFFPKKMKSEHMFVDKWRQQLGIKA